MKNRLLLLGFCMLLSSFIKAQDTLTFYCNEDGYKTTKDSAAFLRKTYLINDLWNVYDYYLTGELKTIGTYNGKNEKQGHFINYHLNEKKLSEGNYKDNKKEGEWNTWYPNGKVLSIANYSSDYLVGAYKSWYDNDSLKIDVNYLTEVSNIKSYEKRDSIGNLIKEEGIFVGTCRYYYSNGQLASQEEWNNDSMIGMKIWNESGVSIPAPKDENGIFVFETHPEFKGGIKGLQKFLGNNLKYPSKLEEDGISGRSIVLFTIETDGSVTDVSIQKRKYDASIYALFDEEAIRVVKETNGHWLPARIHNLPVWTKFTLPVTFALH